VTWNEKWVDIRKTLLSELHGARHDQRMTAAPIRSSIPDLFSFASARETRETSSASVNSPSSPSVRHILTANSPNAIEQLTDEEFDRLLAAVLAEQKRRGKKLPVSHEGSPKRPADAVVAPLTQGKLNAVRAAFKAGVTPSRIARQFGISQSDVRKALASDVVKR
jgi:DNA invertase Pin-like site-specific DNA recombinase